jgi:hypothetical protein
MPNGSHLGVDAWFGWAAQETAKPYGLRHVLASAAKAVVEPAHGQPLFRSDSRLAHMEKRRPTPDLLHHIHKPAFEHVLLFCIDRLGQNPMLRQEMIGICEELSGLNISPQLFANLQLRRVDIAAQKPRITLKNAPSEVDITAFRHAAENGEGIVLHGRDLAVQRRAYTLTQNYAARHAHAPRVARAA